MMHEPTNPYSVKTRATLAAGMLSAIGATACCFGPLLVVTLGFGGAWAARMKSLEPLQPIFFVLTVAFMGFAFHRLFMRPKQCAQGEWCERPEVLKRQRIAFGIVAVAILFMVIFPLFAEYFY